MLVVAARSASANPDVFQAKLLERAAAFGVSVDEGAFAPPKVPTDTPKNVSASDSLDVVEETINFKYGEMDTRKETFRKVIYAKRKKKGQKPKPIVVETGRTNADRVKQKQIKYVVIHSSLGSYEGSIGHLLKKAVAAHFMVGADGRVAVMVDIDDIANHIKNDLIEVASVGIETETGMLKKPYFLASDWDPRERWRMYSSLAWLIRGIHYETGGANGGVPRDTAHVITHEEADAGEPDAHTDPGPYFNSQTYGEFDVRFPGEALTPRQFLMKLVNDDTAPRLFSVAGAFGLSKVEATDREGYGVSRMRLWRFDGGKKGALVSEWEAPAEGLPPSKAELPYPAQPGDYFVEAEDLVHNRTSANLRVEPLQAVPTFQNTAELKPIFLGDEPEATAL